VVEAYDQMMRQVIGPALRQLGFRGTFREFKYGDRGHFGTVRWQKDGRSARRQILGLTANVDYLCGEDRIGWLMPVPGYDTWWDITGGQSFDLVAESVISAVRRYALPAIQAGLEERQQPRVGYQRGYLGDPRRGRREPVLVLRAADGKSLRRAIRFVHRERAPSAASCRGDRDAVCGQLTTTMNRARGLGPSGRA